MENGINQQAGRPHPMALAEKTRAAFRRQNWRLQNRRLQNWRLQNWQLQLLAGGLDFAALAGAAILAYPLAAGSFSQVASPLAWHCAAAALTACLLCQASFAGAGLYAPDALADAIRGLKTMLPRASFVFITLAAAAALTHAPALFSRLWFGGFYAFGCAGLVAVRLALAARLQGWIADGYSTCRVAVIGDNHLTAALVARYASHKSGVRIAGVFDDISRPRGGGPVARLGDIDDLIGFTRTSRVDLVIITLPVEAHGRINAVLRRLEDEPLKIRVLPGPLGLARICPTRLMPGELAGLKLIAVADKPISGAAFFLKNLFDGVAAALLLAVLAPVFLLIALGIRFLSPGPVLFQQKRIGYKSEPFNILKFRTLHHAIAADTAALVRRHDRRVFGFGKFLRETSLDELPQLINVLRGEMSLVGPRPHMAGQHIQGQEFGDILGCYAGRHWVKPGMTGWAQINGWRGPAVTREQIERRVEHDMYYIENWSLTLDFIILARTLFAGFTGENVF